MFANYRLGTMNTMMSFDGNLEPMSILMFILVQIGGRFLKFDLTKAQEKLIQNQLVQACILFAIVFIASKNIITSFIVVSVAYICMHILFNENSRFHILSKKWLHNEKIIDNSRLASLKDVYYNNIKNVLVI